MAIVEIYIKNFKMGGSVVQTSTLLQSVPLSMTDHNLIDPKVKAEMGKAPSLEFAMDVDHPYYDALLQMKTLMRVVFAGETIFRGRVLTVDVDMMGRKQVHCEGDFAFLMDTPQDGTEEKNRETITVHTYLQRLISKHNSMCGDDDHKFHLGEYPNHYSSDIRDEQKIVPAAEQAKQKFGSSSWNSTMDRIEDVLNTFGGYWRTRYVDETHIYLDWLDLYFRPYDESRQRIEVANNLIDFSGSNELDNIFTAVIPIGKQNNKDLFINEYWPSVSAGHAKVNYILVPEIANLGIFSDSELSKGYHTKEDYQNAITNFGMIYKPVTFENADNCDKLFSYATDWIKNNFLGSVTSYDITALDITNIDPEQSSPLLVGDEVKVIHPSIGERTLTIISIDYDLYNPWKTKYKIGSPNNLLNATYGVANKNSGGKKGSGDGITGGGGGGGGTPPPTQQEKDAAQADNLYIKKTEFGEDIQLDDALAFLFHDNQGHKYSAKDISLKFNTNPTLRREFLSLLKDPVFLNNPEFAVQSGLYPNIQAEQQKWRKNVESYLVDDCGVGRDKAEVITNTREGLTWLANITDDDGNLKPPWNMSPKAAELKKMALRTRQALNGSDETETAEPKYGIHVKEYVTDLLGDSLNLDGGMFSYDSENQIFDFGNGKVKMDATGNTVEFDDMEVIRKEVGPSGETRSFGFYDEGNLTAGVMVEKLSDGVTKTKISSDWIDLTSDQTIVKVKNFIGNVTGVSESNWDSYNGITLQQIDASALWQNRNDITGVVGEFEVVGTGDNRRVVIKSGGGLKIERNNVEYGLYDSGNLDAGVIITKINGGGGTTAKITASHIDLDGYTTGGDITLGVISCYTLAGDYVNAGDITFTGTIQKSGAYHETHIFKVDGTEVAKFLGTADVNFDRAAAKKEGARTVTISNSDIVLDGDPDYDADGKFYNVYVEATCSSSLDSSISDTGTQRFKVDATEAYTAGYTKGKSEASPRTVKGIKLTGTPTYASSTCTQQSTVTFSDDATQSNTYTIINVTDAYNAGVTAANAAVTLSHRWDPVNHDGKDRSTFIVENSANSNTKMLYVIAAADKLEYNTSTHKYKTKVYAKGGGAVRGTLEIESGTEAYTAGRNSVGMSSLTVNRISGPSGAVIMVYYTLQNGKKSSQQFTV